MSPPAANVFLNSRSGRSCQNTNTTAAARTRASTIAAGDGRRRMAALMLARRGRGTGPRGPPGRLLADGRQLEDAVERDPLTVALPPAAVAVRARVEAHVLTLE